MAVTAEGARRKERVLCLFDVDGTLTPARQVGPRSSEAPVGSVTRTPGGRMCGLQRRDPRPPGTMCGMRQHPAPDTPGPSAGSDGNPVPHVRARERPRPRSARERKGGSDSGGRKLRAGA